MAGTIFSAVAAPLIGGAVTSIFGGGAKAQNQGGQTAAAAADPFASQRGQYQTQLSTLMSNPGSMQLTAGEQFQEQQGLSATQAQMASKGLSGSGAEADALTKQATGYAQQDYQQEISNLMTLSGANQGNTGAAAGAITTGTTASNAALGTIGNNLGTAVTNSDAFSSWVNGSSAPQADPNAVMNSAQSGATMSVLKDY